MALPKSIKVASISAAVPRIDAIVGDIYGSRLARQDVYEVTVTFVCMSNALRDLHEFLSEEDPPSPPKANEKPKLLGQGVIEGVFDEEVRDG